MSRAIYSVTRSGPNRLHVEARIVPDTAVSVLAMRDSYGPAHDFSSGISNLAVGGHDTRHAWKSGQLLVAGSEPFELSYDCDLPDYSTTTSLLRGFKRGRAIFCPGMALFHLLRDGRTTYEVSIEASAVSSGSIGARPIVFAGELSGRLERTYFAFGDIMVRRANGTTFIHEPDFPLALNDLLEIWPRLVRHIGNLFADEGLADWTVFLFASDEHEPGRPGAGFSLPHGALVSVSSMDDALALPHTLWLLLHEWSHQWLGEAIGRATPADDWFFEGFAYFAACEALARAELLSASAQADLLRLSRRMIRQAGSSGLSKLAHQGFLCAHRWNNLLARRGRSLGSVIATLVETHRGETLQGKNLLDALGQASPGGSVPKEVFRLANAAASYRSAGGPFLV